MPAIHNSGSEQPKTASGSVTLSPSEVADWLIVESSFARDADVRLGLKRAAAMIEALARTPPTTSSAPDERVEQCERCAVLEDLLETATSERDKARDESRKADDEALALKARDVGRLATEMTGSYAAIKAFQRRAEEAETKLAALEASSAVEARLGGGERDTEEMPEVAAMRYIEQLRADEGDAVTILCDNPEAETNERRLAIVCNGGWTGWHDRRYSGESVLQCLSKAVTERETGLITNDGCSPNPARALLTPPSTEGETR